MLFLKSMRIKNLASFNGMGADINGFNHLNVFIGRNNQGKSNLLKAIQFLDYNNILSFLDDIPASTKRFDETRSIGSPRELLSLFHYKSSNFLGAHFRKPIEIFYVLEVDTEPHTYKVRIESLVWKEEGDFTYVDSEGIYRESKEPVATFYDGKNVTLNEALGDPKEVVRPILFSTIDHDFDFGKMKDDMLRVSYEVRKERVIKLLKEMGEVSSDFHKLFLAFGNYVLPRNAAGRHYEEVAKQVYNEKLFLNAELFLDKGGLTSDVLGSGQKQTLALLYELDKAEMTEASIITIDEMELHLYPALQKSVLKKIKNRSKRNQFFISTHSNILISTPLDQAIFFVKKLGDSSIVKSKRTMFGLYEILEDLGIKASDILQSNGVIWVEGPSDTIIIRDWMRKIGVSENALDQISFISYGGASIRRIRFPELLKLNRNCLVIQDSDRKEKDQDPKAMKVWVTEECKSLDIYCWTTERREIENYFTKRAIRTYLMNHPKKKRKSPIHFHNYADIDEIISNYSGDKPGNAREIVSYITKDEITRDKELISELTKIKELIYLWTS